MATDVKNVTAAKPKVGGAIWSAPLGTALPTDAKTALNAAFKCLGFLSEDGLTNEDIRESDEIQAWGGDIVATPQTSKSDKFKYKMIEALNIDVLKEVYGPSNVTGTLETGIKVVSTSEELPSHALVFEIALKDGILKRIVVPNGKVSEVGEIPYVDNDVTGYDTTLQAFPDTTIGGTHVEYIAKGGD